MIGRWRLARFVLLMAIGMCCAFRPTGAIALTDPVLLVPCLAPIGASAEPAALPPPDTRFQCVTRQSALPGREFWVEMNVPGLPRGAQDLRWGSTWQDRVIFQFERADGTRQIRVVTSKDGSRAMGLGAIWRIPVPRGTAPLTRIVARVEGAANVRGVLLAPRIVPMETGARADLGLAAFYGAFLGIAFALLLYNFAVWVVTRFPYQLAYCGMLVAIMAYAVSSSAALGILVPGLDNNDRLRINYALLTVIASLALLFARAFLDKEIWTRGMKRAHAAVQTACYGSMLAFVILAPWQIKVLDGLYSSSFLLFLGLLMIAVARGLRMRSQFVKMYLIAWSAPILLALLRIASGYGVLPYSFLLDNGTLMALCVESLMTALIIAWRIRDVRSDRDAALAQEREARRLADLDPLTGLLNRRALARHACPPEARRYRLVLIDIDHFKNVNDHAGHETGDRVLASIAAIVAGAIRPDAIAARMGGEEFAILFPADDLEKRSYSNLLMRVRRAELPGGVKVTISMGLADGTLGPDESLWRDLYRRADTALYAAKQAGRNRMVRADRPMLAA